MVSHLRNGGRLEKAGGPDLEMHGVVYVGENVCGQKRVSAQREEVIMDTDLFDLQDLCPESGKHFLEGRPWRDEGLRFGDAASEPELRRQAYTLHFARRALWELVDDEHLARSEEHTSELQSQFHLVCRLLLEKKNTQ